MCILFMFLWWWHVRVPSQEHPKGKDHRKMAESFPREGKKRPMEPTPTPPPAPRLDSERLGDALGNKEQRGCSWLSLHSLCPLHILKVPYGFGKIIQTLFWNKTFNPWADEAAEGCGGTQDKQRKGLVFSLVTREQLPADNLLSTVPIERLDSHPEELRTGRAVGWGGR